MFHDNMQRYLGDLFTEYPQYQDEFIRRGGDKSKMERLDLRDDFKTFVIRKKFPTTDVSSDIWKEVLRFNGHFLNLTLTWIDKMIRFLGVADFNVTVELMFQHKVAHTQQAYRNQKLYSQERK